MLKLFLYEHILFAVMVFATAVVSFLVVLYSLSSFVDAKGQRYNGPKDCDAWRQQYPYHHPPPDHRRKVYIRASVNDTDDISGDFYSGLKRANHGGTLVLPKGKKFVIGKKLDLTFLDDIQVQLDGEIKVHIAEC